ncbi:MAG: MFS transporter [Pirellulaceae bacterium]
MPQQNATTIGRSQYLALAAALLGWMFDGAEMGVFSLVGRASLKDLLQNPAEDQLNIWFGIVMAGFLVGASTGGVLFGWLGDRVGRVRAMTLSVLTYALFTGLCGLASSPLQLGVLRFVAALGMGGEWSLGVALVMEVWPNRSRAFMAGLIGAAANVGYLIVALIGLMLSQVLADLSGMLSSLGLSQETVAWLTSHQGWRIMMILGSAPALLTFLIRIFVPESERWQHEQRQGRTSHWQTSDLLGVLVGVAGPALMIYLWGYPRTDWKLIQFEHTWTWRVVGTFVGLVVATLGYTYPVVRYLRRQSAAQGVDDLTRRTLRRMLLAAGLSGVALLGTWGAAQWAPSWADKLTGGDPAVGAKYYTQMWTALGAILGTLLAALSGDWVGRRVTYAAMCLLSIVSLLALFQGPAEYNGFFLVRSFAVGIFTAAFYGWLPLYLPELFRTSVRATGQGFGFNFGRILAAVGTLQAGNLFAAKVTLLGREYAGGYPLACSLMSSIYLLGLVLICFAPETKGQTLPE